VNGRLFAAGEVLVEHVLGVRLHLNKSTPRRRGSWRSGFHLGGEILGDIDQQRLRLVDVAQRTAPIACMSSTSILAARVDMLLKKKLRTASLAPLKRRCQLVLVEVAPSASAPSRCRV